MKKNDKYKELDSRIKINMEPYGGQLSFFRQNEGRLHVERGTGIIIILAVMLAVSLFLSIFLTANIFIANFSAARYIRTVVRNFDGFFNFILDRTGVNGMDMTVYRVLIVGLVGAALSVSGAVYQGIFRNPLASPGILGVQSGGVLAGVLFIFLFKAESAETTVYSHEEFLAYYTNMSFFEKYAMQLAIIIGAFISVFLIVSIAMAAGRGKISTVALLLAGSVFSSFISSGISLVRYYTILLDPTDPRIAALQLFMMGSFNNAFTRQHLLFIGIPVLLCIGILWCIRIRINVLVFSEDEARAMGIKVDAFRNVLIVLATVLTAVTIAFCGQIGFVGLMVPHLTRYVTGPDYKTFLPASALFGAMLLILIYDLAVALNSASYVNLFASFIGGPLFMILMVKSRRERNADWA